MPTSFLSARLTRGTKVEVFTRKKDVVYGSWLPATILSGNGHSYLIQYHEDFPPGFPMAYDRVPRKAIRRPWEKQLFLIEVSSDSSSCETSTSPLPWSTKKARVADWQTRYRVPDLNVAEIEEEEEDTASVGSNSPGRGEGNPQPEWERSMLCHREELNQYRSLMTMWHICESLGVTLIDLVLGRRKTKMIHPHRRHQTPRDYDDDDDDALSSTA